MNEKLRLKKANHDKQWRELRKVETKLTAMIAKTENDELMNLFSEWTTQRTKVNESYVEFLSEMIKER